MKINCIKNMLNREIFVGVWGVVIVRGGCRCVYNDHVDITQLLSEKIFSAIKPVSLIRPIQLKN